jgi:C4-dicarboxylate transporter DctQ subunit
MAVLTVMEAVLRTFFKSPTTWSYDVCSYVLIWTFCLGLAYGFQAKGHVAVDLFVNIIRKRFGRAPVKVLAVIAYIATLLVLLAFMISAVNLFRASVRYDRMTNGVFQIPEAVLDVAIVFGATLSIVTVVFVIWDLLSGGTEYSE